MGDGGGDFCCQPSCFFSFLGGCWCGVQWECRVLSRPFLGEAISKEVVSRKCECPLCLHHCWLAQLCVFSSSVCPPPSLLSLSLLPSTSSSFSPPFPPHLLSSLHPSLPPYSPLLLFSLDTSFQPEPHNLCHRIGETDLVASLALASHECHHKELPQVLSHFALLPAVATLCTNEPRNELRAPAWWGKPAGEGQAPRSAQPPLERSCSLVLMTQMRRWD